MNSEFAVSFFISIIKFVFKFTIFTVNMNSSNLPPSKKKKKETLSKKTFNKWCCGNNFDNEVDSDDNVVKVTPNMYPIFATNSSRSQSNRFAWVGSGQFAKAY